MRDSCNAQQREQSKQPHCATGFLEFYNSNFGSKTMALSVALSVYFLAHLHIIHATTAHDDMVITEECWRASAWTDIKQHHRLSKPHIIHNAVPVPFCDYIMEETMEYVAENGWSTDRHAKGTETTDIDTILVDGLNASIIDMVADF